MVIRAVFDGKPGNRPHTHFKLALGHACWLASETHDAGQHPAENQEHSTRRRV